MAVEKPSKFSQTFIDSFTQAIHRCCPNAKIETVDADLVAKDATLMYTIHRRLMTGEVLAKTYQQEGPNSKGFVLKISQGEGKWEDSETQAVLPQIMSGPYFKTLLAAANTTQGRHYYIQFSYGTRLDPELKKKLLAAIPFDSEGKIAIGKMLEMP